MKLKEFFPSALKMARLKLLDPMRLNQSSAQDLPVIVSCTSIPSRFHVLNITIRSVLNQTRPPKKIILWLHERHKGKLPDSLLSVEGKKFEIRFTDLDSPHCKLVPTLLSHPTETIVTCDDDLIYDPEWLERLWLDHETNPNYIIANRCNLISYDTDGNTLPYRQWVKDVPAGTISPAIMPAGYGGVIYPPGSLNSDVTNHELYLTLSPKADDLWFKAMSYLNGTLCKKASIPGQRPMPIIGSKKITLSRVNIKEDQNREQWNAIRAHYKFRTPDA
ncbi:MAG: hypothetical protein JXQ97_15425 [Natronospirillum sp.]